MGVDQHFEPSRVSVTRTATRASDVARELHDCRRRLLGSWTKCAAWEIEAARRLDASALAESLAPLLDYLEDILEQGKRQPSVLDRVGSQHGAERAGLEGYDLNALLVEYRIFRGLLFELLQERVDVGYAVENTIHDTLDRSLAKAGAEFLRLRSAGEHEAAERIMRDEQQLRLLMESVPSLLLLVDSELRVLLCNKATCECFGLSVEQAVGQRIDRVFPSYDQFAPYVRRALAGETVRLEEATVTFPGSATVKHLEGTLVPWPSHDGDVRGFVASLTDQSERQRLLAETRQAVVFEQQLIGIVSHDLRTPLAAITMGCSLLANADLGERANRTVARIRRAADRATRMIRDLLDLTQTRLGRGLPLDRRECVLDDVVKHVLDEVATSYPDRTIEVDVNVGQGVWDADRIGQVVSNLVNNALVHSPPRSVVTVQAWGEQSTAILEVHNEGAGIPADVLPRLFEPLERPQGVRKPGTRSIGLGLFITKQIVEAHSGHIDVRSDSEHGTTVRVALPRNVVERDTRNVND